MVTLPKLPTLAVLWTLVGPARFGMLTKLQMVAVLWTLLGPARKNAEKAFNTTGPKTIHRNASVGSFGNMTTELLALAVLIQDFVMDQNYCHQQF